MLIDSTNIQFKEYSQGMDSLFPSRLDENISSDARSGLPTRLVDEFDISLLLSTYKGGCCPAYYSRMLFESAVLRLPSSIISYPKILTALYQGYLL